MNSISLTGRLIRDPEIKTTTTGKTVASFSIAVRKAMKPRDGEPDADFFNIETWGQSAEFVQNYGAKGRDVAVTGRMESRQYMDKEGGKRTVWDVKTDRVEFIGGVKDSTPAVSPVEGTAYDPFADE